MGDVEQNIEWNCENNGEKREYLPEIPLHYFPIATGVIKPFHIAHTWGTGWNADALNINYIVASDILLYVR